jgi:predicted dehydrogenase
VYTAAVIGTGRSFAADAAHSVGYLHARAYRKAGCRLVAAAARTHESLARFLRTHDLPESAGFHDWTALLEHARPELVSIATYPDTHAEAVLAAASVGVRGIWCEKPFCTSMDEGRRAVEACERNGVRLVVNHQRRFLDLFRVLRQALSSGAIGRPLLFVTAGRGWDLMDWGSHWFDLFRYLAGDQPVEWVLGQGRTGGSRRYDHLREEHGVSYLAFADGTRALLEGGEPSPDDHALRLIGTDGLLAASADGRITLTCASGRHELAARSDLHQAAPGEPDPFDLALRSLLAWIEGGAEPGISGRNALASSELYLAAYESWRRRDRVDLPLAEQPAFPLTEIVDGAARE